MARPKKDRIIVIEEQLAKLSQERRELYDKLDQNRKEEKPLVLEHCLLKAEAALPGEDDRIVVKFAQALAKETQPGIEEEDIVAIAQMYLEQNKSAKSTVNE